MQKTGVKKSSSVTDIEDELLPTTPTFYNIISNGTLKNSKTCKIKLFMFIYVELAQLSDIRTFEKLTNIFLP